MDQKLPSLKSIHSMIAGRKGQNLFNKSSKARYIPSYIVLRWKCNHFLLTYLKIISVRCIGVSNA